MIFSRFFRPQWQHSNPKKRIAAVAGLDPADDEQRRLLRELAFNDEDRQVRQAALGRLATLELWYLAGHQDADAGLRKHALAQVSSRLCDASADVAKVSDFVGHCKDSKLIESLWRQLPHAQARQAALTRLHKERLFADAADHDADSALRLWAAAHIDSDKLLARLAKKARDPQVAAQAQARIDEREAASNALLQRAEQTRLLLARLNAQGDKLAEPQAMAQPELAAPSEQLLAEWAALQPLLSEEQQQKGEQLASRLATRLAQLNGHWQQQQQALLQQQQAQAQFQALDNALTAQQQQLNQAIEAQQQPDLAAAQTQLAAIESQIAAAAFDDRQRQQLQTKLKRNNAQLASLADYQQHLALAQALIAELAAETISDEAVINVLPAWQQRWQPLARLPLPLALKQELTELQQQWQQAATLLRQQQQERSSALRRLLARLADHQRAGRLRQVIRDFHQCQKLFATLPANEQAGLAKRMNDWQAQVSELEDWHQYVARPKQQELVEAIEALAATPLGDAAEQAREVRELRQQWRVLVAPAADDEARALEQRFNVASEQAFAPCRDYYAELDKQRELNRQARVQLIDELSAALAANEQQPLVQSELESLLRRLTRRWQESGEVDFAVRAELNQQYRERIGQLRALLRAVQQHNADGKQALIRAAEALAGQTGREVREQFRALREQWRQFGYAGGQDQALWQQFKAVGEALRQADEAAWQARNAAVAEAEAEISAGLDTLAADSEHFSQRADELANLIEQLPPRTREPHRHRLDGLRQQQQQLRRQVQQQAAQQGQRQLLKALQAKEPLPAPYSQWAAAAQAASHELTPRHELTVLLELSAGLPSPEADSALRQQLQLKRLKDRLEGQSGADEQQQLLGQWLAHGPLSASEQPLLARLERILGLA